MKRNRNFKTSMLLLLRKLGMLCRKPQPTKRLRISRTIWPDRDTDIQSQQHVWVETKKISRQSCKFDSTTMSCICGIASVEEFTFQKCKN